MRNIFGSVICRQIVQFDDKSDANAMAILKLLLEEFCDVFPNDLPFGLPPEKTIEHGIDLMSNSKLVS